MVLINAISLTHSVNTNHGLKLTPKLTSTLIALSMWTVIHTLMQLQIDCWWQPELLTTDTKGNGEEMDPSLPPERSAASEGRGANASWGWCSGRGGFSVSVIRSLEKRSWQKIRRNREQLIIWQPLCLSHANCVGSFYSSHNKDDAWAWVLYAMFHFICLFPVFPNLETWIWVSK